MARCRVIGTAGLTGVVLWLSALWLSAGAAHGYSYQTCHGERLRWHHDPTLVVDSCTVVGERLHAVREAVQAWNDILGARVHIRLVEDGTCGLRYRDGENTISYVPGHVIDGALGLTLRSYGSTCSAYSPYAPRIVEADVMLNADDPQRPMRMQAVCAPGSECARWQARPRCEETRGQTVRNTIIHELGHFLGLNHYDDDLAVMMTHNGEGVYCGGQPWGPMPDDILAIRRLYGRTDQAVRELSVTGQRWIAPDRLWRVGWGLTREQLEGIPAPNRARLADEHLPAGAVRMRSGCAGELLDTQIALANRGTLAGLYRVHWLASRDREWSPDDIRLGITPWRVMGAERFEALEHTIRVSRWLDPALDYRLLYVVEPAWGWAAERRWGDNVGILPGALRRRPEGDCP